MTSTSVDTGVLQLNERLTAYPSNHTYRIKGDQIQPSRELAARWRAISRFYPEAVTSFLDIGSCKGYFVFQQASRPECEAAIGIDVNADFVDLARAVARHICRSDVRFENMTLEQAATDPAALGGPFRLVQVISTYHYMYWGSAVRQQGDLSHEPILARLAALCSGAIIFANPLSVDAAPRQIRQRAEEHPRHNYTPEAFVTAACRFFDVYRLGYLHPVRRRRTIILLVRRD